MIRPTLLALVATIMTVFSGHTQEPTYQGLLWKISGNGLKSPSYLYGTMHVSDKLVFNLPDEFFKALQGVDAVALESLPNTWLDDMKKMEQSPLKKYWSLNAGTRRGYDPYDHVFDFEQPFLGRFRGYLDVRDYMVNGILYRKNHGNENFELDTYLDMFLFQSGSKLNKQMYSLEDNGQVEKWIAEARRKDREEKARAKIQYWNMDESMNMEEAYRRGDLDLLDSISRLTSTENMHNAMIVKRNEVMAQQMDSIMNVHSLFTGVGAAHLAGDYGVINLLREMGYTVEATNQKSSNKSIKARQKLETLTRPVTFTNRKTADGVITVATPEPLMSMSGGMYFGNFNNEEQAIDYVNGAYYGVSRIHTYAPFFAMDEQHIMSSIDSVLFIDMPGDVIESKKINISGFPGYDVLAKTYKGDIIRYQLAITPLEIVIFKAIGVGEYVTKQSSAFFKSIQIKYHKSQGEDMLQAGRIGFKTQGIVKFPRVVEEGVMPGAPIEAFDKSTGTYFLLQRNSYQDEFLEDDQFELEYIAERFAKNMKMEMVNYSITSVGKYPAVRAIFRKDDSTECEAMFTLKGADYYCLLSNKAGTPEVESAFASLSFQPVEKQEILESFTDTVGHYEVVTFDLEDRFKDEIKEYRETLEARYGYMDEAEEDPFEEYRPVRHMRIFTDPMTGDFISLRYRQQDKFYMADSTEDNLDSLRSRAEKRFQDKIIVSLELDSLENGVREDIILADTASSRGLRVLKLWTGPRYYEVKTYYDTLEGLSPFVKTFFETFQPLDTVYEDNIYTDKTPMFMELWRGDSTQREIAEEFFNRMLYRIEDADALLEMLNCYLEKEEIEEKENEGKDKDSPYPNFYDEYGYMDEDRPSSEYVNAILRRLCRVDSVNLDAMRDLYLAETEDADRQMQVIRVLAGQNTLPAYELILQLFDEDVPAVRSDYSIKNTFNAILRTDSLAIEIFPSLYRLKRYPEFRNSAMSALITLYEKDRISSAELKRYQMDVEDQLDLVIRDKKSGNDSYNGEFNALSDAINSRIEEVMEAMKEASTTMDINRASAPAILEDFGFFSDISFQNDHLLGLLNLLRESGGTENPVYKKSMDRLMALEDTTLLLEIKVNDHLKAYRTDTAFFGQILKNEEYALEAYDLLDRAGIVDTLDLKVNQMDMVTWTMQPVTNMYQWRQDEEDTLIFLEKRYIESPSDTGYVYFFKSGTKGNWQLKQSTVQPADTTEYNADSHGRNGYSDMDYRYDYDYMGMGQGSKKMETDEDFDKAMNEAMRELSLRHHPRIGGGDRRFGYNDYPEAMAEEYYDY